MKSENLSRRQVLAAGAAGLAALPACTAGHSERLQITDVEIFKVVVPIQDDIINSPEFNPDALSEFPKGPKFIIKLHTDSGLFGIGETGRNVEDAGVQENADYLKGKSIFDLNLADLGLPSRRTYRGFEIAIFDALGKAVGWPVYQLLGGLAQEKVLVTYWCGRKNPTDVKRVAERALAGKFTNLKMKGRPGDPIVKTVEAVAQVAPDLKITVDFNSYHKTVEEFMPIGEGLDAIGNMSTIEDPIVKENLDGFREIDQRLKTAVTLTAGNPKMMIDAIRKDACTYFNTGPNPGMTGFVRNAYLAGGAGKPVWHGSGHELGIKDAAFVQTCAAAANCTLSSDIVSYQRVDDLIVEPINIQDSYAIVPDKPGLGVELDEDAVQRYRVQS